MSAIDAILAAVVDREGDRYTNDPADAGGPTRWGITLAALAEYRGHAVTAADVQALARDEALAIYRSRYVDRPGYAAIASISDSIAAEVIDTGVNMGPETSTEFLQRVLNVLNHNGHDWPDVAVDGQCGAHTAAALAALIAARGRAGERVVLTALNCLQGAQYIHLAEVKQQDERFVYGWLSQRVAIAA